MSLAVHKLTCLLRHGIPRVLKGAPQVFEVLGYRVMSLYMATADSIRFLSDSGLEKVQASPFEVPRFHNDATLSSWSIGVHEDAVHAGT